MGKSRKKERTRGNKYAHMVLPQAELDYHHLGVLTRDEICLHAQEFLQDCHNRGMRRVLIITGKGLHSSSGPVIGPALRSFLPTLAYVETFETARRDRGGAGAIEVLLKQ